MWCVSVLHFCCLTVMSQYLVVDQWPWSPWAATRGQQAETVTVHCSALQDSWGGTQHTSFMVTATKQDLPSPPPLLPAIWYCQLTLLTVLCLKPLRLVFCLLPTHCQPLGSWPSLYLAFVPGVVSLRKVKLNTRLEHESINNFKVLQASFQKLGVDKVSDAGALYISVLASCCERALLRPQEFACALCWCGVCITVLWNCCVLLICACSVT